MKGSLTRLLCAILAVSSAYADTVHYGKTYMLQRSQGVSLEKEYVTFHKHLAMSSEDRVGGSIQVVPFYQESASKKCSDCTGAASATSQSTKYGRYFGRKNETTTVASASCDTDCSNIEGWVGVDAAAGQALVPRDVFHLSRYKVDNNELDNYTAVKLNTDRSVLKDNVQINPESKSVGARFDYHQKLDSLLEGLFFKISVPVVNNKTSVNAKTIGANTPQKLALAYADADGTDLGGESKTFLDYLAGKVSSTDVANRQDALAKAKIVACSYDKTGVADVDFVVGYNFLREEEYHAGLNIGVTFPTGTKTCGEYLFEPRVGTDHWAFGAGFEAGVTAWSADNWDLALLLVGNYRYLFKDKEMRTASDGKFSHYKLGDRSDAKADAAFFPLANVLTMEYDVTPGSQFEMLLNVAFTWDCFTFDLGYNLYFREEEKVELRDCNANVLAKVGVANHDATAHLTGGDTKRVIPTTLLSDEELKTNWLGAMQTPRQLTHKIYAAAGYVMCEWEYPVSVGVFGGYEFTDNAAMEQWHVGGKVGVTF